MTTDSRPIYLYAGHSKDIKRRLDGHFSGNQQNINRHIEALLRS